MTYPLDLIKYGQPPPDARLLEQRPFINFNNNLEREAHLFYPGETLETAINTAIALGEPLLITGESGTGKTQTAYYVANRLGTEVLNFQVKSNTVAQDLFYSFDTVRYFYEANVRDKGTPLPDKSAFIQKGKFWQAFEAQKVCVLLIDEIDKAPRDFPNDLLHEVDQMNFYVPEMEKTISLKSEMLRPIVIVTSNSERRLPEPFLRRCVYHNIRFTRKIVEKAIEVRRHEYHGLSDDIIQMALLHFLALRERPDLQKLPSTGEFMVWLRILSLATQTEIDKLKTARLADLPYLGVLLKDAQDHNSIAKS